MVPYLRKLPAIPLTGFSPLRHPQVLRIAQLNLVLSHGQGRGLPQTLHSESGQGMGTLSEW